MHNGNRIVVSVLACCLALLATAGCSDSKSRQAGQNVTDKITKAQELGNRAMAMMANTTFEDMASQKFTPTRQNEAKASKPDDIRLLPPTAVNPQAIESLKMAHAELSKAIADNPDAPAQIIDLGHITLGRLAAIMGDYNAYFAQAQAAQAAVSIADARNTVELLYAQADVVHTLADLSTVAYAKLPGIIEEINADIQKAEKAKTDASKSLEDSRTKLKELRTIYDGQILKTTELQRQSEDLTTTDRHQSLKIFDEATKALVEAMKTNSEISVLERTISVQTSVLQFAEQKLAAVQNRLMVAKNAQTAQSGAADSAKEAKDAAMNKAQTIQKTFAGDVATLAENLEAMKKASAQATQDYERAVKSFAQAAMMAKKDDLSDERYNEALIGQASTTASLAAQSISPLSVQIPISDILVRADAAFAMLGVEAPPEVKKVKELLVAKPADARQVAADKYEDAAKIYTKITGVPPEQKWSYDSLQAAAYSQVFLNSGKDTQKNTALGIASKLLVSTMKGREKSPYLADVARIHKTLPLSSAPADMPVTPEQTPPATPASPETPATPVAPDAPADNK